MKPALRIVCSVHGRGVAWVVYEGGRAMFKTSTSTIPLDVIVDLAPAKCPHCDSTHLILIEDIRRALRSRSAVLARRPPSVQDYLAAGRYPPEAYEESDAVLEFDD